MRIGNGFDVHALVAGRRLVLGGVTIAYERGLAGHSDADALLHAICDAILGALAAGDLGAHFPDTDTAHKDADSRTLLRRVWQRAIDTFADSPGDVASPGQERPFAGVTCTVQARSIVVLVSA